MAGLTELSNSALCSSNMAPLALQMKGDSIRLEMRFI